MKQRRPIPHAGQLGVDLRQVVDEMVGDTRIALCGV
jgi:hypothetical protein